MRGNANLDNQNCLLLEAKNVCIGSYKWREIESPRSPRG